MWSFLLLPVVGLLAAAIGFAVVPVANFLLTFGLDVAALSVEPCLLLQKNLDEGLSGSFSVRFTTLLLS